MQSSVRVWLKLGKEGVFVKGNMRFMIADDLSVQLVSVTTCFAHLSKLGVSNWTSLEAKSVKISAEERDIRCALKRQNTPKVLNELM
ncbi:hypothetical protein ACLOJK_011031 [Asimina triloba]